MMMRLLAPSLLLSSCVWAGGLPPYESRGAHLCGFAAKPPPPPSSRVPRWAPPPVEELANYTATIALGRWTRDGIQFAQVLAAADMDVFCMSLRIVDGEVLAGCGVGAVQRHAQPFMNSRYNYFTELVEAAMAIQKIPDLQLAWCPGDCVAKRPSDVNAYTGTAAKTVSCPDVDRPTYGTTKSGAGASELPMFTPVSCLGSDAIAAPMQYKRPILPLSMAWKMWPSTQERLLHAPIRKTTDKIVLRGRMGTRCWDGVNGSFWGTAEECGRGTLRKLEVEHPEAIDFNGVPLMMVTRRGMVHSTISRTRL